MELTDKLYDEITFLCSEGDKLVDNSEFDEALVEYRKALNLLPKPAEQWEAAVWIYTAIGDTYFYKKEYEAAIKFLFNAYNCPDGFSNPFINLRIGECFFELNNSDRATEYLLRAYMMKGKEIFEAEEEKYFKHLSSCVKL